MTVHIFCPKSPLKFRINVLSIHDVRANSLQSCPTLCAPMDYSPPRSSVLRNYPGKNTGVSCHALLQRSSQPRDQNYISCTEGTELNPGSIPGSGRSTGEGICYPLQYSWASLVAQLVKNVPVTRETWVPSLGWESPWRTCTPSFFFFFFAFTLFYCPPNYKCSRILIR